MFGKHLTLLRETFDNKLGHYRFNNCHEYVGNGIYIVYP
jgi:hypothetical protein